MEIPRAVNADAAGSCSPVTPISSPAPFPTGGCAHLVERSYSATRPPSLRANDEPTAQPTKSHLVGRSWIFRLVDGAGDSRRLRELRTPDRRRSPRRVHVGVPARWRTTARPTDVALSDLQARSAAQARVAPDLVHRLPAMATVRTRSPSGRRHLDGRAWRLGAGRGGCRSRGRELGAPRRIRLQRGTVDRAERAPCRPARTDVCAETDEGQR